MVRPKILIADDDSKMRSALRTRLAAMGYCPVLCDDGLGVISQSAGEQFSAIILDHEMPNGDGRTIARLIRNESRIPIVFLSGHDADDFHDIIWDLQDVYYLPKPLDRKNLTDLLANIVSGQAAA